MILFRLFMVFPIAVVALAFVSFALLFAAGTCLVRPCSRGRDAALDRSSRPGV